MGTATSNQEEPESSNVKNDQSGDSKAPTEGELNEYKGDNDDKKEIVPIHGVQVRSFLGAPGICPPGYRMDAAGKCRKVH